MAGDKGDISRGEKLFQKVSQGDKFKKIIEENMREFQKEIRSFSYSLYKPLMGTPEKSIEFNKRIDLILEKNALPINAWWQRRLKTFILFKDKKDLLPVLWSFQTAFIDIVNHYVQPDGSYNDIRLYEGVSQMDVRDFMMENWKLMKPSYRVGTTQKIRKQSTREIRMLKDAGRLMKNSKEKLGIPKKVPKDIYVSTKMNKKYGGRVSNENLLAKLYRTKKKKR